MPAGARSITLGCLPASLDAQSLQITRRRRRARGRIQCAHRPRSGRLRQPSWTARIRELEDQVAVTRPKSRLAAAGEWLPEARLPRAPAAKSPGGRHAPLKQPREHRIAAHPRTLLRVGARVSTNLAAHQAGESANEGTGAGAEAFAWLRSARNSHRQPARQVVYRHA